MKLAPDAVLAIASPTCVVEGQITCYEVLVSLLSFLSLDLHNRRVHATFFYRTGLEVEEE